MRQCGETGRFRDGLFYDGAETIGYVGFLRGDVTLEQADCWLARSLDAWELYECHCAGDLSGFLTREILPPILNAAKSLRVQIWIGEAGALQNRWNLRPKAPGTRWSIHPFGRWEAEKTEIPQPIFLAPFLVPRAKVFPLVQGCSNLTPVFQPHERKTPS